MIMELESPPVNPKRSARVKLLDAAVKVIRTKGYAATTVEDLCVAAGVTKGAFFHHFRSKDELAVAAANHWSETTGALFAQAPYHAPEDPLERVLAYLDFRAVLLAGTLPEITCLVGTLLQETYETAPAIRQASFACISAHAATLEADFAQTIARYGRPPCPSARSLALHTQTVLQGAFIMAKGSGNADVAHEGVAHLRRYLSLLFHQPQERDHEPAR